MSGPNLEWEDERGRQFCLMLSGETIHAAWWECAKFKEKLTPQARIEIPRDKFLEFAHTLDHDTPREALRSVVSAIENGTLLEDHRDRVYRQEFGAAFLRSMKKALEQCG